MKSLLIALLFASVSASAVTVEPGFYTATDVESGEIQATMDIREDKNLTFNVTTPSFTMPEPGCNGTYDVQDNLFLSDLKCPLAFLSEVSVQIDISTVTPESVRSEEGAIVKVVIDALGSDATEFRLKKVEQ